jgi:hypothetical protein
MNSKRKNTNASHVDYDLKVVKKLLSTVEGKGKER